MVKSWLINQRTIAVTGVKNLKKYLLLEDNAMPKNLQLKKETNFLIFGKYFVLYHCNFFFYFLKMSCCFYICWHVLQFRATVVMDVMFLFMWFLTTTSTTQGYSFQYTSFCESAMVSHSSPSRMIRCCNLYYRYLL